MAGFAVVVCRGFEASPEQFQELEIRGLLKDGSDAVSVDGGSWNSEQEGEEIAQVEAARVAEERRWNLEGLAATSEIAKFESGECIFVIRFIEERRRPHSITAHDATSTEQNNASIFISDRSSAAMREPLGSKRRQHLIRMRRKIFVVSGIVVALILASIMYVFFLRGHSADGESDSVSVYEAVGRADELKGETLRWNGKTLGISKTGDKIVMILVKRGYLVLATLKSPLTETIGKDSIVIVEGVYDGFSDFTLSTESASGEGYMLNLKEAQVQVKQE